jgi:acyl-CoA reductase-like NAD-dependent aldehyde dehydrogenase
MALDSVRQLAELYGRMPAWENNEVPLGDHFVGSSVRLSIRRFEPSGVVAAITPYNFPLITNIWKVVPALLAGCTVVLRPSPLTPLEAIVLGEAAEEADLPPGVLNVVPEAGNEGGVLLSTHRAVDVVSFTGSTTVGRAIATQAASTLKRVILELGGKSVQLHLPDTFADGGLGSVIVASLTVFASHAGQGCALQTRLLVPEDTRARVLDAVAAAAASLPIGDPSDRANLVGPLVSRAQRDRVHGIVTDAIDDGARLVSGGRRPEHLDRGWFYEPTVLDAPSNANPAAQREVFGPVLTVMGNYDIDEAVAIANDHELGLSAGVYTGDLAQGLAIAERIRSGTVQVNTGWASGYTPMGGYKQSGYGRERGAAGIRAFQELKHVVVGSR